MVVPESFFNVEFNKAVAFGYKTDEVDEFVTKAIELIKGLQEENDVLQNKLGVLATNLEKYREDEDSLRSALIGAQKLGDSILKDSRSKAEVILRDATTKAGHIVEEAHTRLRQETQEYERVKTEVTNFRENLISMYKTHIDQICKIPHTEKPQESPQPEEKTAPPAVPQPSEPREAHPAEKVAEPQPPAPREQPRREAAPTAEPDSLTEERQESGRNTRTPTFQLELEEDDEDNFEDEVILSKFGNKVNKIISQGDENASSAFEEDDEDDEYEPLERKSIFSPKFGELKFGESFSLTKDGDRPAKIKK